MVIQDIDTYESNRQTIAMLKLAALDQKSVESGDVKPARKGFEDIETRRKSRRG